MRSKDTEFAAVKLPRCLVCGGANHDKKNPVETQVPQHNLKNTVVLVNSPRSLQNYGVAAISRLLKITGLFCKRAL